MSDQIAVGNLLRAFQSRIAATTTIQRVTTLLSAGYRVNQNAGPDELGHEGWNALHELTYAVNTTDPGVNLCRLLVLDYGADVNARTTHESLCMPIGSTPLHFVAAYGIRVNADMMDALIWLHADVNALDNKGFSPLNTLLFYCRFIDTEPSDQQFSNLLIAMQSLIRAGAVINEPRLPSLGIAASECSNYVALPICQTLFENNAEINGQDVHGKTALHKCSSRNTQVLAWLLNHGANVRIADNDGCTPLHYQMDVQHASMLIDHGAVVDAVDKNGETPLVKAIKHFSPDTCKRLLEANASSVNIGTPVVECCNVLAEQSEQQCDMNDEDHLLAIEILKMLIEAKADVNKPEINAHNVIEWSALDSAVYAGYIDAVELLIEAKANVRYRDRQGWTALHISRKREITEALIEAGAKVNAENSHHFTPLTNQLYDLNSETFNDQFLENVQALIDNRADVNFRSKTHDASYIPYSPLQLAVTHDEEAKLTTMLLKAGANVHYVNPFNQRTALHECLYYSPIKVLIQHEANVNAVDVDGETPLHMACQNVTADACALLIEAGAVIDSKNKHGFTPLHLTTDEHIAITLVSLGADPALVQLKVLPLWWHKVLEERQRYLYAKHVEAFMHASLPDSRRPPREGGNPTSIHDISSETLTHIARDYVLLNMNGQGPS